MSQISAILLTAGESTRMGKPKALLDWFGKPLIQWQIDTLIDAGVDEVIVVLGHLHDLISLSITGNKVSTVVNNNYKQGKTSSIKTGLNMVSEEANHILLISVDQPRPKWLISLVIDKHLQNKPLVTAPRFEDHGGHPVIYSISLKSNLENISEANLGVRQIMSRYTNEIQWVTVDSPLATLDLNTPKVYYEAKRMFTKLLNT